METIITVNLEVKIPYYEDKSGLSESEFANAVYASPSVSEARKELAQEIKIAAIKLLAGEYTPTLSHTRFKGPIAMNSEDVITVSYLADGRVEVKKKEVSMPDLKEILIEEHGEQYRTMIESALDFLDEKEPEWGLVIDREEYIADLVKRAK